MKVGDKIIAGDNVDILTGNCLPLKNIPQGTMVHNVELKPGKGGQMARSAGAGAGRRKRGDYVSVKMPSGEIRKIYQTASRPSVRSATSITRTCRSAGRPQPLAGQRPHVRGVAMNPVDHPLAVVKARRQAAVTR